MTSDRPTILVVEDDELISRALTIRLEAADFNVQQAFDADAALDTARQFTPDLAVLDISMPGGDGIGVARQLRAEPETGAIPVIFLTASKRPDLRERAAEIQGAAFFEKPYDAKELLAQVHNLLGASRAGE